MGTIKQLSRIFSDDASLNRLQDQLASALNPILRNVQGDLSGPLEFPKVVGLQGYSVSTIAPIMGQVLAFDGKQWVPQNSGGGSFVTSVTASSPLASSGGLTPNISLTGVVSAAHGGTGLSSSGTDSTKFLNSDGAGGWQLSTPAGGAPSGPAGGVLGYPGSTYPNPTGLAALPGASPADWLIPVARTGTPYVISIKPDIVPVGGYYIAGQGIELVGGDTSSNSGIGGTVAIRGGAAANAPGGTASVIGGGGSAAYPYYNGGNAYIYGGQGANDVTGRGGDTFVLGGKGSFYGVIANGFGGDVHIAGGVGYNFATGGKVNIGDQSYAGVNTTTEINIGVSGGPSKLTWQGQQVSIVGANAPATNQVLMWNGSAWVPASIFSVPHYYISLTDSTPVVSVPSASALSITYDTVEDSSGMTLVSGSRITASVAGLYQFDISPQLTVTSGISNDISLFLKKNGVNVAKSNSQVTLGNNGNKLFPFMGVTIRLAAGDYVEWCINGSSLNGQIISLPATAILPSTPGVIAFARLISY